jgi:hypothetical protein
MMPALEPIKTSLDPWFDHLVATLRVHQVQLETETASPELKNLYEVILSGNSDQMAMLNKVSAQKHFVGRIVHDYIKLLGKRLPRKLAFDFNDSEVLVWAEINDDDEDMEGFLIMTEAKINAKYHDFGFDMTTMLVEVCDQLPVPNHYQIFIG